MGYMNATRLPKELIELILLYVGVLDLHRTGGSYREMNMNSMRKLLNKEKKEEDTDSWLFLGVGKIFFTSLSQFFAGSEVFIVGMILLVVLGSFASLNVRIH
jgi:hypothetical protein